MVWIVRVLGLFSASPNFPQKLKQKKKLNQFYAPGWLPWLAPLAGWLAPLAGSPWLVWGREEQESESEPSARASQRPERESEPRAKRQSEGVARERSQSEGWAKGQSERGML